MRLVFVDALYWIALANPADPAETGQPHAEAAPKAGNQTIIL